MPNRRKCNVNCNFSGLIQKFFKSGELKSFLISLSTILIYYCFSIFLTFYNRHLFVIYKYPLSITLIHLIFKFCTASLIRSILNCFSKKKYRPREHEADYLIQEKRITLDWSTYFRRIIPTGIASAADIGFSNWSLQYITISLYTMTKSTVILFIFFFSILFKLEKWRHSIISIVSCIAFGLFLFTFHSTEFHVGGFVLAMLASFFAGLRWTLAQTVTQKHELGLSNPIDMIYHIQPGMILILLPLAVYVEGVSVISTNKFFRVEDLETALSNCLWIIIGAFIAFFLEASEYLVVTYTSSLTLSISGIFKVKKVIIFKYSVFCGFQRSWYHTQVLVPKYCQDQHLRMIPVSLTNKKKRSVIWNHNKLNTMNTLGLVICLIGITIHVIIKGKEKADSMKDETQRTNLRTNRSYFNNDDEFETNVDSSGSDFILKKMMKKENKQKNEREKNGRKNFNDHQNQPLLNDNEND